MNADADSAPILFATDFSAAAASARDWAVFLAQDRGSRLELVHALTLPPAPDDLVPPSAKFYEELRTAAEARVGKEMEELRQLGLTVDGALGLGSPSGAILDRAAEVHAAAIVLSTRGLSGLRHFLLGSTAERVVQHASCPVLTVHPEQAGEPRAVRTLILPTDFSTDVRPALAAVSALFPAKLERVLLLHAFNLPIEYTAYGPIPTSLHYLEDAGLEAERRLAELATSLEATGLPIETRAAEGYPPEVIDQVARDEKADLIALTTHGRSGLRHLLLGSVAERVVQHASCPVLTVLRQEG